MRWDGVVLALVLLGVLAWRWHLDRKRWLRWRAGLLRSCENLLSQTSHEVDPAGWPLLHGRFEGHPATLRVLMDDVAYRKLPVLWLMVTVRAALPSATACSAMARPQGTEYWSRHEFFDVRSSTPSGWPTDVRVRGDNHHSLPAAAVTSGREFFCGEGAKELALSARGVRLTAMAMEARRPEYLVIRSPKFESHEVRADQAARMMRWAVRLAGDLVATDAAATHVR